MRRIKIRTCFDITETGIVRNFRPESLPITTRLGIRINNEDEWNFSRKQQSNLEVLIQTLSLRTQIHNLSLNTVTKGKNKWWTITFEVEHIEVYSDKDDELGLLKKDCLHLPMLINLNETQNNLNYITEENTTFSIEDD